MRLSQILWIAVVGFLYLLSTTYRPGGSDSTPISRASNLLAKSGDRLSEEEIDYMTEHAKLPPSLQASETYPPYGSRPLLFRRQSGQARLTIFDGGHLKDTEAAFSWLNTQKKG